LAHEGVAGGGKARCIARLSRVESAATSSSDAGAVRASGPRSFSARSAAASAAFFFAATSVAAWRFASCAYRRSHATRALEACSCALASSSRRLAFSVCCAVFVRGDRGGDGRLGRARRTVVGALLEAGPSPVAAASSEPSHSEPLVGTSSVAGAEGPEADGASLCASANFCSECRRGESSAHGRGLLGIAPAPILFATGLLERGDGGGYAARRWLRVLLGPPLMGLKGRLWNEALPLVTPTQAAVLPITVS